LTEKSPVISEERKITDHYQPGTCPY